MRHLFFCLYLCLPILCFAQEDIEYKEYSYTEFFQMIEAEEDTVFNLSDAIISYNPDTDSLFTAIVSSLVEQDIRNAVITRKDTLVIDKALLLDNVHFKSSAISISGQNVIPILTGFQKIIFKRKVTMTNSLSVLFNEITFEKEFSFTSDDRFKAILIQLKEEIEEAVQTPFGEVRNTNNDIYFTKVNFLKGINLDYGPRKAWGEITSLGGSVEFVECNLRGKVNPETQFLTRNKALKIEESIFNINPVLMIRGLNTSYFAFNKNIVNSSIDLEISANENQQMDISNNTFHKYVILDLDNYQNGNVEWNQWENKVIDHRYRQFTNMASAQNASFSEVMTLLYGDSTLKHHQTFTRKENKTAHKSNLRLLTDFYNQYKLQHDTENANLVYTELKDLETQRLRHSYQQSPNFENFFTWKINQFLAVFSAYGTKPAKAIVFSMKVILAFALIYLFFPNHWDSHGKNRIIDRFSFFLKYMKKDAGMHDVYLEEKQGDILAYDDYKLLLESSGKDVPKFFQATGLPLYKWAISSTKLTAGFLSRVDVMKGTWSELPQSKRVWKSVLLITAFLIAMLYDIFIKMLNALMLSINTFTTLGFGEIPIKGLPRYLAIIQGFIGWFMLTIFSVSLISQLLN